MRYALVDGQGNFGSVDGDPPAAYRYTEARLQSLAEAMMTDLDKDTVDFRPTFDETNDEPVVLPTPFPNLLDQRIDGHRGRHGDEHSAAQHARGDRRRDRRDRAAARDGRREVPRADAGDSRRPTSRPAAPSSAAPGIVRAYKTGRGGFTLRGKATFEESKKGERVVDRHHRDSLPGQQGDAGRRNRRARAREEDRGHFRPARRIQPRRHAHRHRTEARRAARRRPEQPLPAHEAADQLRHHAAGHRRRAPAGAEPAGGRRAVHRVPARRRPPPDRVRTAQSRGPGAHPRGPEDRARPPGRGHHADPRVEEPGRGQRGPRSRTSA